MNNRFSGTMNSRMGAGGLNRNSLGGGIQRHESTAYLDSVNDDNFRRIVQEMGMIIN